MKLNTDIIYHHLSQIYHVEMYGKKSGELTLCRPEFYMEDENIFLSNHLYLATVEHLPRRPRIQENAVLVCIGENLQLNYYKERMNVIVIKNRCDFFKAYQAVQEIFDRYDAWEKRIYEDLVEGYDIQQILADSREIFTHPAYVLDKSFRVIATNDDAFHPDWASTGNGSLSADALSKFLSASDLMTEKKNALKLDILDIKTICVNLFQKNDQYEGCLCVPQEENAFVDGEDRLAELLGSFIERVIEKNPFMINDTQSSVKNVMKTLLEEQPLNYSQRIILNNLNHNAAYCCIYMQYAKTHSQLPMTYICDIFEDTFSNSYAFIYDEGMVAFVDIYAIKGKESNYMIPLNRKMNDFVKKMGVCAGISNDFDDLFNIRIHYKQAQSAVENGLLVDINSRLFYFASYALMEMVINSLGNLPAQAYFPSGFKAIIEHDKTSGVSYLETLKVFLEENMSFTSTAEKLCIHRSTLIDRISRIQKEMGIDLKDADRRLQLEIVLKAMDLEEMLSKK